jgi:hypothetical protein
VNNSLPLGCSPKGCTISPVGTNLLATLVTFHKPTREDCRSCAVADHANVRATTSNAMFVIVSVVGLFMMFLLPHGMRELRATAKTDVE